MIELVRLENPSSLANTLTGSSMPGMNELKAANLASPRERVSHMNEICGGGGDHKTSEQ